MYYACSCDKAFMKYYPCNLFLYQWLAYTHGRRNILKIVSRCAAVLLLLKIIAMSSCNHHTSSDQTKGTPFLT